MRAVAAAGVALIAASPLAHAERITNTSAVFAGLDKVTAQISTFEVALGKTVAFGSLLVTPRACYSRPSTEMPKTTTFVEVDEVQLDGTKKRIFTGWMFAESPGLHGVEHPTIDVWLNACKGGRQVASERRAKPSGDPIGDMIDDGGQSSESEAVDPFPRRRVRR